MAEQALLDNDVALKISCYALVAEALAAIGSRDGSVGMLGVSRFVLRNRIERGNGIADPTRAMAELEHLLASVDLLEPNEEELALAADLEAEAQRLELELDGGESQLLSILATRALRVLLTGDKRAIVAMSVVAPSLAAGRVACFEQMMAALVLRSGVDIVRRCVCDEPAIDKAITACCACTQPAVTIEDVLGGLDSYIGHLARNAPDVLASDCLK